MASKTHFKPTGNVMAAVVFLGLLLAGCGERPSEIATADSASSCPNPGSPINLSASKFDPATKQGWYVNGPGFPEQKKDVPTGRYDNQIALELAVPAGASAARVKLQFSGTVPAAAVILDTIWYIGLKEVGRGSPNIELGKTPGNVLNTTQPVAPGADRLMLIARPWRQSDGILTVGAGELAWCKK